MRKPRAWQIAFLGIALCHSAWIVAQVKTEEALKRAPPAAVQPSAKPDPKPAAPRAQTKALPCQQQPSGCTTRFTPVADSLAPQWYAQQEKNPDDARRAKEKAIAYLAKYHAHARKRGWELNDVARAYGFFVSLTYNVYSKGQGPDRAELETLTSRFRKELLADPKFQANSERDKQFIYERLILIALDNEAALVHARREENPAREEEHRKRARAWLEDIMERPVEQIPALWR